MDMYTSAYYGVEIVVSIAGILLLLRIAKAVQNVLDMMDIYLQFLPGAEKLRHPRP